MSKEYDLYLEEHKANVAKGFHWLREHLPKFVDGHEGLEWQICYNHDASKNDLEEYEAYDRYFYGGNRSYMVVEQFNYAWLRHIHKNPHHWQHWVLINDDPGEGEKIMDMPIHYILEMICDWWAFSWKAGNLREMFKWYDQHKDYMKLSNFTRTNVEIILGEINKKLDELENAEV